MTKNFIKPYAQTPDGKPGREQALRQKVFSVLIFCYFFIKKKVVASAAMSGQNISLNGNICKNP
jgi:hypothetical protein